VVAAIERSVQAARLQASAARSPEGAQKNSSSEREPGAMFRDLDAPWCPELVVIPAGSFVMGSPDDEKGRDRDEEPQHRVRFAAAFALGRYPVTFEEYDRFCIETARQQPADQGWGRGRLPVINVAWDDAQAYCAWLSERTGQPYRLPSEAEWEYACRAGTTTPFWTGVTIGAAEANYDGGYAYGSGDVGEYRERTTPVDAFAMNPWGVYDLHGNVWEWCEDCWNDSYDGAPSDGSAWLDGDCSLRAVRGGSWYGEPRYMRSACRSKNERADRGSNLGFRIARTLAP
jgi:formylglycine-generating enzyme required for sulfatase activity